MTTEWKYLPTFQDVAEAQAQASRDAEVEELRQQLTHRDAEVAELNESVTILRKAINNECLCIAQFGSDPPAFLLYALAATEPKP